MEYMMKIDDYITGHAIDNMIRILNGLDIKSMTKEEIMSKYDLKTDMDYFHFMIDCVSFADSYQKYRNALNDLIKDNKPNKRAIKRT